MAKKITAVVKVQLKAGQATPAPPLGPALGQHGANIMMFVKEYNARTEKMIGQIVPVEITIYADRSFTFITRTPPASQLLLKALGKEKGSGAALREKVGVKSFVFRGSQSNRHRHRHKEHQRSAMNDWFERGKCASNFYPGSRQFHYVN